MHAALLFCALIDSIICKLSILLLRQETTNGERNYDINYDEILEKMEKKKRTKKYK